MNDKRKYKAAIEELSSAEIWNPSKIQLWYYSKLIENNIEPVPAHYVNPVKRTIIVFVTINIMMFIIYELILREYSIKHGVYMGISFAILDYVWIRKYRKKHNLSRWEDL